MFTQLQVSVGGRVSKEVLRSSLMGLPDFDGSSGRNLVKGAYRGLTFSMSDIQLQREVAPGPFDENQNPSLTTFFTRQVYVCDLGRPLLTDVQLWTEYACPNGIFVFRSTDGNVDHSPIQTSFHIEAKEPGWLSRVLTPLQWSSCIS